ncbi:hypothetical protein NLG42_19845 [Flavobacterium plurextorum]|uniref:hypothetical protein n=1 Tax=Flavobacterium TaxID=237 RepID=UPI00214D39B7|nr:MULTISPECIES: hypothetical protein [Flavobacterium]UUW08349.1 hypothetical protein NLG42_19845 [Flavobacterium plurextorum]
MMKKERKLSFVMRVEQLIEAVLLRLQTIDSKISKGKALRPEYYRNEYLKKIFELSTNIIIKYRVKVFNRKVKESLKLLSVFFESIEKDFKIGSTNIAVCCSCSVLD